jgi:hypothetical protein
MWPETGANGNLHDVGLARQHYRTETYSSRTGRLSLRSELRPKIKGKNVSKVLSRLLTSN